MTQIFKKMSKPEKKKTERYSEKEKIIKKLGDFIPKESEAFRIFKDRGFVTVDLILSFYMLFHEQYPQFCIDRVAKRNKNLMIIFFDNHIKEMKEMIKYFYVVNDDDKIVGSETTKNE